MIRKIAVGVVFLQVLIMAYWQVLGWLQGQTVLIFLGVDAILVGLAWLEKRGRSRMAQWGMIALAHVAIWGFNLPYAPISVTSTWLLIPLLLAFRLNRRAAWGLLAANLVLAWGLAAGEYFLGLTFFYPDPDGSRLSFDAPALTGAFIALGWLFSSMSVQAEAK